MEPHRSVERFKRLRRNLQRQIQWSRNVFLVLLVVSVVNLVLLWAKVDYHFLFSVSLPYYLNWMAIRMGRLRVPAILVAVAVLALGGGCWYFFRNRRWLEIAIGFYVVDTLALAVMALTLLENPLSCLLEVLTHCLALMLIFPARKAALRLENLNRHMEEKQV